MNRPIKFRVWDFFHKQLINRANILGVYDIASVVIDDPRFELWSGSIKNINITMVKVV